MASSEQPALEALNPEPPGGPTAMQQAHVNGMRKTLARMKNQLKDPEHAEESIKAGLLTYLGEWEEMYGDGVRSSGLTTTERTILVIRRDTIHQAIKELGGTV